MLVTLNGKALKALLIDMPLTLGVIVSMVSHRMRTSDPFHNEGEVVPVLVKDGGPKISSIESMVDPESFVSAWWSWHVAFVQLTKINPARKET